LVGSLRAFHSPRIASERLTEVLCDHSGAYANCRNRAPELLGCDAPLLGPVFNFPRLVDVDLRAVWLAAKMEIVRHGGLLFSTMDHDREVVAPQGQRRFYGGA
jgi:hypothetical protein